MHRTHTPLRLWFWAAYLVATPTPGISAVQLQRQLGLSRYETAWLMLQSCAGRWWPPSAFCSRQSFEVGPLGSALRRRCLKGAEHVAHHEAGLCLAHPVGAFGFDP